MIWLTFIGCWQKKGSGIWDLAFNIWELALKIQPISTSFSKEIHFWKMRDSTRKIEGHVCPGHMQKRSFYGTYWNVGVFQKKRRKPTKKS